MNAATATGVLLSRGVQGKKSCIRRTSWLDLMEDIRAFFFLLLASILHLYFVQESLFIAHSLFFQVKATDASSRSQDRLQARNPLK